MPSSPPRLCRCGGKVRGDCCDRCGPKRRAEDNRKHAAARGYGYKWQKFRASYLASNPLCHDCEERGIVRPATDVHHRQRLVERPELKYDEDNLMPLCHECHSVRTARGE